MDIVKEKNQREETQQVRFNNDSNVRDQACRISRPVEKSESRCLQAGWQIESSGP